MSGLTDEERELKRLAEAAAAKAFNGRESLYIHGLFESRATPATVLRLLARIETLAKAVRDWGDYADERDRQWREATGRDEP